MKLFAPKYYKDFICIADKCKHSCCINWEIDIDEDTMNRYSSLSEDYAEAIKGSIHHSPAPHFKLDGDQRCPHLTDRGLCKIVLNVGEDYLCDICREHPRFYNYTSRGKEVGIGMACEEACRLILNSDDYDQMIEIGEAPSMPDNCEFDAIENRETLYKILKDEDLAFDGKIEMMYDYYDIYLDDLSIPDITSALEYLDNAHKELFANCSKELWNTDITPQLERILAYFIYRHCSEACDFDEFYAALCFSIFCTRLISSISTVENVNDMARIVSEEIEYSDENTEKIKSLFY